MHIKFNGIGSCILMKLRNLNMLITSYDQYVVHFCIKWKFDRSIRNKWNADIFSRTLLVSVVVSVCATSKCIFIYRSRKMNRTVWQQHNNKKETSSNHKFIYKNDTVHTVFFRCYFICMAGWKKKQINELSIYSTYWKCTSHWYEWQNPSRTHGKKWHLFIVVWWCTFNAVFNDCWFLLISSVCFNWFWRCSLFNGTKSKKPQELGHLDTFHFYWMAAEKNAAMNLCGCFYVFQHAIPYRDMRMIWKKKIDL